MRCRTDTPTTWDERTTLVVMLDYVRDTALHKCDDLADELAHRAPLVTSPRSTIGGFLNHLRWVEHSWFEHRFLGAPDRGPWTDDDPDRELSLGAELPLTEVRNGYAAQRRATDEIIAAHDLDDRATLPVSNGEHPTLRWIVLHTIEETARHNGHLDILRELLDGRTGA